MLIAQSDLNAYRSTLDAIAESAISFVSDVITDSDGCGIAAMRCAAIQALTESIGIHGVLAQQLACSLFDEMCDYMSIDAKTARLFSDIVDFDRMERRVRYLAKSVVESGDASQFIGQGSALAGLYARRCNWEAMARNCQANHVRYARIPTGEETCDWCIMLASRGFAYYTADTAQHANHLNCRCIIMPGTESTQVEGYDPDALYDRWIDSGFMPPKYNKTGHRIVFPNPNGRRRSYSRTIRRRQREERGLTPSVIESYYAALNAFTMDPDALGEEFKRVFEKVRNDPRAKGGDIEDVANHYAYLLTEYHKLKIAA